MLTFNCLSCGFLIKTNENAESYTCEACCNTWTHVQLTEYKQKVQDTLTKVTQDFEKIENQAKEERERRIADDERKKQTEAYIARRQADVELEKAKSANRPQTVYGMVEPERKVLKMQLVCLSLRNLQMQKTLQPRFFQMILRIFPQYEELSQMNEQTEKMAAKFPDNFVLTPPPKEVADKYISKTLAIKARKRA